MSTTSGSEFDFRKIFFWGVMIALGSVGFVVTAITIANVAKSHKPLDPEAVNLRIAPVATVKIAAATTAGGAARSGEQIFQSACAACHETGAAGAPKVGDKAAWAARLSQGLNGLLKAAIAGKNAMPPRGGSDATDAELASAIVYMANKSGANFKEPPAK